MTREEAVKGLKVLAKDFSGYKPNEEMFDMAIKALEQPDAETVDAVPVVRCKDCKFSKPINAMAIECTVWADARLKVDFCSAGELKERDNDS